MKVLKTRLDRFYARLADGEALGEGEMEEGRRMEKLLRRWVRCVEEDAGREDEDKARFGEGRGKGWLGWLF